MNLDAARRRRQIVREAQLARSTALANATAQGGAQSSALAGGFAQIENQKTDALLGVNQSQELGTEIFRANAKQREGQSLANVGSAFQSIGGQIMQNRGAIGRVGQYTFSQAYPGLGTNAFG